MKNHLEISIHDHNAFYNLYSDGNHSWKTYDKKRQTTLLYYPPGSVILLYYTYRTYREALLIRFERIENGIYLPGLSKKVKLLFRATASRVDKTRRAIGWLKAHTKDAFINSDDFYIRLSYIIEQKGKINYFALKKLAENFSALNK